MEHLAEYTILVCRCCVPQSVSTPKLSSESVQDSRIYPAIRGAVLRTQKSDVTDLSIRRKMLIVIRRGLQTVI